MAKRTRLDDIPKLDVSKWEEKSLQHHRKRIGDLEWFAKGQLSLWKDDLTSTNEALCEAAKKHVENWRYILHAASDRRVVLETEHARRQSIFRKARADAEKAIIGGA